MIDEQVTHVLSFCFRVNGDSLTQKALAAVQGLPDPSDTRETQPTKSSSTDLNTVAPPTATNEKAA